MPKGVYERKMTPRWRASLDRLHAANRGRPAPPRTPDQIANLASGVRRAYATDPTYRERVAAGARRSDDRVGYATVHVRLDRVLPRECAHCGATAELDVALRQGDWIGLRCDLRRRSPPFTTLPEAYFRLCRPCHHRYDGTAANFAGTVV